jgi:hypothetical protein
MATHSSDFYRKALGLSGAAPQAAAAPAAPRGPSTNYWQAPASAPLDLGGGRANYSNASVLPTAGLPDDDKPPDGGGGSGLGAWEHFLQLLGAGAPNAGDGSNWFERPGEHWRRNQRGFDLFGLAPQQIYWENLQGSGHNPNPANLWTPDRLYGAEYGKGKHHDGDWFRRNIDSLKSVWSQLLAPEQQTFRDRLLNGTGLPGYLQAFQKARPQWMIDYINSSLR